MRRRNSSGNDKKIRKDSKELYHEDWNNFGKEDKHIDEIIKEREAEAWDNMGPCAKLTSCCQRERERESEFEEEEKEDCYRNCMAKWKKASLCKKVTIALVCGGFLYGGYQYLNKQSKQSNIRNLQASERSVRSYCILCLRNMRGYYCNNADSTIIKQRFRDFKNVQYRVFSEVSYDECAQIIQGQGMRFAEDNVSLNQYDLINHRDLYEMEANFVKRCTGNNDLEGATSCTCRWSGAPTENTELEIGDVKVRCIWDGYGQDPYLCNVRKEKPEFATECNGEGGEGS